MMPPSRRLRSRSHIDGTAVLTTKSRAFPEKSLSGRAASEQPVQFDTSRFESSMPKLGEGQAETFDFLGSRTSARGHRGLSLGISSSHGSNSTAPCQGLRTGVGGRSAASSDLGVGGIKDPERHLFCRCEAAESAARQLFGVMDAVLCKLHYSVHDQIEVAWICGADYLPYVLEGRAHVRCELRNDLFSAHYPAPISSAALKPAAYHQPLPQFMKVP
jgi:hypothetical protein